MGVDREHKMKATWCMDSFSEDYLYRILGREFQTSSLTAEKAFSKPLPNKPLEKASLGDDFCWLILISYWAGYSFKNLSLKQFRAL